jgi:hypothetical protein
MKNPWSKNWRLCEQVFTCDADEVFTKQYVYEPTQLTWFEARQEIRNISEFSGSRTSKYIRHINSLKQYTLLEDLPEDEVERGKTFGERLSAYLQGRCPPIKIARDNHPEHQWVIGSYDRQKMMQAITITALILLGVGTGLARLIQSEGNFNPQLKPTLESK